MKNAFSQSPAPRRKGEYCKFTIIKLLVVIAIIAILADMLLPALKAARSKVLSVSCLNNEKMIGIAAVQYLGDNKDFMPMSGNYLEDWHHQLARYMNLTGKEGTWKTFASPDDPRNKFNGMLSYGMFRGIARQSISGSSGDSWTWGTSIATTKFKYPSKTYFFGERNFPGYDYSSGGLTVKESAKSKNLSLWCNANECGGAGTLIWNALHIGPLHNNFTTTGMLYLDGHAASLKTWTAKYSTLNNVSYHQNPSLMQDK